MLTSIFNMDLMRKLSFLVLLLCLYVSLKNQNAETKKGSTNSSSNAAIWSSSSDWSSIFSSPSVRSERLASFPRSLEYDFYRDSCPRAEQIVHEVVRKHYRSRPDVAPGLLRLAFHDCFIEGCDGSVLLDVADGVDSEKKAVPNQSLKGFDVIDNIKSELEEVCPGVVSCADILVLAARESVVLAGGPFYPLYTGRRDSLHAFLELANSELPSPHGSLPETLASFASRGFDERETVSLLGAHSIGVIHCAFVLNRLYQFAGTDDPDPSMDTEFLRVIRSRCNNSHVSPSSVTTLVYGSTAALISPLPSSNDSIPPSASPLPSPSPSPNTPRSPPPPKEPVLEMDYERSGSSFGTLYYRSLLQGKGILYADQQLMVGEETGTWVRAYASDASLFRRDFAMAMMKLSNLRVLTEPMGQIRRHCAKVV